MNNQEKPTFVPQRIYLKDASYEMPNAPGIFLQMQKWEPEISVEMDNSVTAIDADGFYDVQLKVTVTAKVEERIAYIAEVVQAGVFLISGFDDNDRQRITGAVCPDTLFPYVREALANLMTKGGFPPFLLNPVNFDYIYNKQLSTNAPDNTAANAAGEA